MEYKSRKKGGKMRRRIFSIAMALAMVVTAFALPQNTSTVQAAGVNAPSEGTYWTKDQLSELGDSSTGTPYYATGTTFQKANYGGKEWYAIGADEGCLVMLSPSQIATSKFDDSSTDYSTSYIYNGLNGDSPDATQQAYNKNTLFSSEELGYIFSTVEGGKIYLPDGNSSDLFSFTVGSLDQYKIPFANWVGNNGRHGVGEFFWLRSTAYGFNVFCGDPYGGVCNFPPSKDSGSVVPAFNLNLSSVLFSSAAPVPQGGTDNVTVNGSMRFRFDGSEKIKSTATYYGGKVNVTKSGEDSGLYLCIQYNYASKDWFYSEEISESGEVDPSIDSDLSNAKIWLEKKDGSLLYAKMATAGSKPNPDTNPNPTPDNGKKHSEVRVTRGSVVDITNSSQVAKSENPFSASIGNASLLEQLLGITAREKEEGVNVWLVLKDAANSMSNADKKALFAAKKSNSAIGLYLDVSLYKNVGDEMRTEVKNLNGKLKVSFVVPENLRKNGRNFEMIRLHEGKTSILPGTYNATTGMLTFETDGFSSYALAYTDAAAAPNAATTSPKTGETSNMLVWLIIMLSALGMTGIVVARKRY